MPAGKALGRSFTALASSVVAFASVAGIMLVSPVAAAAAPATPAVDLSLPPAPGSARAVRQQTFDAFLAERTASGDLVGVSVVVVDHGRLAMLRGYGHRSVSGAAAVDDRTVFHLASLSKTFAAGLTGMLVRDRVLDWSTPLRAVLPGVSLGAPRSGLTIGDLLSHRTGLPPNAYDDLLEAGVPARDILPRLAKVPPACKPGTCYAYQNLTFNLVADAIQARTGKSYADLMRQRIFAPLHMDRASLGSAGLRHDDNWARPHVRAGTGWREVGLREPYYALQAAAGVNASGRDMAQWLLAQLGRMPAAYAPDIAATLQTPRVKTPKDLRSLRNRFVDTRDAAYGYGWRIYDIGGTQVVAHAGTVQGYIAQIAFVPAQQSGIVILTNASSPHFRTILPAYMELFVEGVRPQEQALAPLRRQTAATATRSVVH